MRWSISGAWEFLFPAEGGPHRDPAGGGDRCPHGWVSSSGPPRTSPTGAPGWPTPESERRRDFTRLSIFADCARTSRTVSNVAFQNMGAPEEGSITLRTTVFSGDPDGAASPGPGRERAATRRLPPVFERVGQRRQRLRQGGAGGGKRALLRLRRHQRPGQLRRVLRLPDRGRLSRGGRRTDPTGYGGDLELFQRVDADQRLGYAQGVVSQIRGRRNPDPRPLGHHPGAAGCRTATGDSRGNQVGSQSGSGRHGFDQR